MCGLTLNTSAYHVNGDSDKLHLEPQQIKSMYEAKYDPALVLQHPDFQVLENDDPLLKDGTSNIACAYNEKHEVRMMRKPMPEARTGEVVIRVRATGICG